VRSYSVDLYVGVPKSVTCRAREIAEVSLSSTRYIEPINKKQYLSNSTSLSPVYHNPTHQPFGDATAAATSVSSGASSSIAANSPLLLTDSEVDEKKGVELLRCFMEVQDWENCSDEELGRIKALLAVCR
jgi:hypothetical protein